jgi:hypothetical protein
LGEKGSTWNFGVHGTVQCREEEKNRCERRGYKYPQIQICNGNMKTRNLREISQNLRELKVSTDVKV